VSGFDRAAGDAAGAETLEIMSAAPKYNRWMYDAIAPWLGRRVLEIGSGIGNMSAHILAGERERVVLTDIDPWYLDRLREQFQDRSEVDVQELTLPDPTAESRYADEQLDTVVALNVVEHIEDDVGTLRTMAGLLTPGGRAVILVPALQSIFGSLDEELGHFRRYSRASLSAAFERAGLRLEHMTWYNRVGVLGWWLNARVRRVKRIPLDQLRAFDRMVPALRYERFFPLPFGQSLIAIGTPNAS
jgi:SAM-dependent methyltransferase